MGAIEHGILEHQSWPLWSHGKQSEGSVITACRFDTEQGSALAWRRGVTMAWLVHCDGLSVLLTSYFFPAGNKLDMYHFCLLWNVKWFMSNRAELLTLGGSTWLAAQPDKSPGKIFKGCLKENSFNDTINKYTHLMRKWHCSWKGDIYKEFTSWIISRDDLFRLLPIADGLKTLELLNIFC